MNPAFKGHVHPAGTPGCAGQKTLLFCLPCSRGARGPSGNVRPQGLRVSRDGAGHFPDSPRAEAAGQRVHVCRRSDCFSPESISAALQTQNRLIRVVGRSPVGGGGCWAKFAASRVTRPCTRQVGTRGRDALSERTFLTWLLLLNLFCAIKNIKASLHDKKECT